MELVIDHLVLSGLGLPPQAAGRVAGAAGRELARLLALHGLPAGLAAGIPPGAVAAPAVHLVPGMSEAAMAAELAQSIYRSLLRLA